MLLYGLLKVKCYASSSMTVWMNRIFSSTAGGQHERVEVVFAHRPVDHVQRPRQRQPHLDDGVESAGAQRPPVERGAGGAKPNAADGVQRVADVQVVGERLGPVLGGMHGGVGGDEGLLPARRRAFVVMAVQRGLIVGVGIAEQLVEALRCTPATG